MSEESNIEWCDDTVNFLRGCRKKSPGCENCYITTTPIFRFTGQKHGSKRVKGMGAVALARRLNKKPWISDTTGAAFSNLDVEPGLAQFPKGFHRRRVFSLSLGDWLDRENPVAWITEMLHTVYTCGDINWILCSKDWKNFDLILSACGEYACFHASEFMEPAGFIDWLAQWKAGEAPKRVFGLCSVENQEWADKRVPQFLRLPLAGHGLSVEPLLDPVTLWLNGIDWVIVGGESGPDARLCHVEWIRDVVKQCQASAVPVFVKQLGANSTGWGCDDDFGVKMTDGNDGFLVANFKNKKGGDPSEWPQDLNVRQFPPMLS